MGRAGRGEPGAGEPSPALAVLWRGEQLVEQPLVSVGTLVGRERLDPRGIGEIRALLTALNEAGTTVVLSSHLLTEVDALCHRVGVMDAGRLVLDQDLATLRAPTGRVLVRTPDPAAAVAALNGRVVARAGDTLTVRHDDPAALNARLVGAGVRVAGLTAERRTLEQVVLELTGHGTDRMDAGVTP